MDIKVETAIQKKKANMSNQYKQYAIKRNNAKNRSA